MVGNWTRNGRVTSLIVWLVAALVLAGCAQQDGVRLQATWAAGVQSNFPGALYRGNAARTGEYPVDAAPSLSEQSWIFLAEQFDSIETPPIYAEDLILFLTMNDGLHAVDAETGQVDWVIEDADAAFIPTVVDEILFYGSREALHAIDIQTRQEKWKFNVGAQDGRNSPLVYAGVVYFGSWTGTVYAVNVETGQLIWEAKLDDMISSAPSIDDGIIYVVSGEDKMTSDEIEYQDTLHALDIQNGSSLWKFSPPGGEPTPGVEQTHGVIGDPIIYDGVVYAATEYRADLGPGYLYAFDARGGIELWRYTPTAGTLDSPRALAADNGLVYISASNYLGGRSYEGVTYAIDATTGEEKWRFKAGRFTTTAMIAGDTIFVGSGNADETTTYSALSVMTGTKLREITVDSTSPISPLIANGTLYTAGNSYEPSQSKIIAIK
jgi:eukaryotic-like serine/threonine-protein kinase